jgi:acetyltransferase
LLHDEKRHPLEVFFAPRSVAVIGATEREGSVGRTILWNLISNPFGGTVFPVNAKRVNVLGIKSWPSVSAVPEKIDLAVVVTPAPMVPGVIRECAEAKIRGAIRSPPVSGKRRRAGCGWSGIRGSRAPRMHVG